MKSMRAEFTELNTYRWYNKIGICVREPHNIILDLGQRVLITVLRLELNI